MTGPGGKELSASLEDYLEAIFRIAREKQAARAKDIGKLMQVSRSSVTGALRALSERGLINYAPYDLITLTDKGKAVAEDVARRHEVLRDFFVNVLAVDQQEADAAACKVEHAISETILARFVQYLEFVERCPRGGSKWIRGFGYHCDQNRHMDNCEECVATTLDKVRSNRVTEPVDTEATLTLGAMEPGDKAVIVKIAGSGAIRRRLLDMGVTAGTLVEVERVAPLGDPVEVKIKGYHLTLRNDEAEWIQVQAI